MKDRIQIYESAMKWIEQNTIDGNGIAVTSSRQVIYPEVTGYYIPTLLEWGERDLAVSYAKFLCDIQKEDGSWYDYDDKDAYVFDSAQILKGLVAAREIIPEVDAHIIKGCDWIIRNIDEEGRLHTPSQEAWGDDDSFCSELIHTYCLTPLVAAADIYKNDSYRDAAMKVKNYYLSHYRDKISNFSLLSHFYAYVMEGLLDLGETEVVRQAMDNIQKIQDHKGGIPGLIDVQWVCSTGMFQLALVWYKLGELEKGDRIFNYACSLQNESGGWYGSYSGSLKNKLFAKGRKRAYYFPDEEISWANKYFLDALAYKEKLEFEKMAPIFNESIEEADGRYRLIEQKVAEKMQGSDKRLKICDVGCGKGRYLNNLYQHFSDNKYYGVDISIQVMKEITIPIRKTCGRITKIPFEDGAFDIVYTCEVLEHAINIKGAVLELIRVTDRGGILVIIDKPIEKKGKLKLAEWETWIDDRMITQIVENQDGLKLEIVRSVPYSGKDDGLFRAWIIHKLL